MESTSPADVPTTGQAGPAKKSTTGVATDRIERFVIDMQKAQSNESTPPVHRGILARIVHSILAIGVGVLAEVLHANGVLFPGADDSPKPEGE